MKSFRTLLVLTLAVLWASAMASPAAERYKIVAYYLASPEPARYFPPEKIPAAKLTHLNYAFANVQGGEMVVGNPALDTSGPNNFAKLRELKKKHPHLKTLIAVGGWAWSRHFSDAALTAESRARFADSGVAFIRQHGFDGIDVDWEFPVAGGMADNVRRPEDKRNFTLLLQAIRNKLDAAGRADGRPYLLTAALGNNKGALSNIEPVPVASALDWVNVMAYDMNGTWNKYAAHVAPLHRDPGLTLAEADPQNNVADLIDLYLAAGVPSRKIVLGVPFYGYSWKNCGAPNDGEYQLCDGLGRGTWEDGVLDYSDIEATLVNKNGFKRHWNAAVKAPHVYNPQTGEFVTYEDRQSLKAKLRFLKQRKLGGAMFWELTGDRRHVLLNTLARELPRAGG